MINLEIFCKSGPRSSLLSHYCPVATEPINDDDDDDDLNRHRRHNTTLCDPGDNLQLSITSTSLIDKNFLPRMLHMDSY